MAAGILVGSVADVEEDAIFVRASHGYVRISTTSGDIAIYQASSARALAAVLNAAADRCGDE